MSNLQQNTFIEHPIPSVKSNVRQTSIDCYNQIKTQGLLTKRRLEVYEAIYNCAPCTSAEAMASILNQTNILSQSRARFTELRELGVIYEKGEKVCSISGKTAIEWDLTDKLPLNVKPIIKTKKDRVCDAINALRELHDKIQVNTASDADWLLVIKLITTI